MKRLYKKLKESIEKAIREADRCYGDERRRFIVVLRGVKSLDIMEKVRKRIESNIIKVIKGLPIVLDIKCSVVETKEDIYKVLNFSG